MQEQLGFLVRLHQFDKAIENVLLNTEEVPKRMERIDQERLQAQEAYQGFVRELDDLRKQRKLLEREVDDSDQKIKKSQLKLMEVKNNKEYKAMLTEIEEQKQAKETKEDQLLVILERFDEQTKKEKELKKSLEKTVSEAKARKDHLEQEGKAYVRELQDLEQQRKSLLTHIDPEVLEKYEFLRKRLKGAAVAEVRGSICLGCHIHIPPQMYNELHRQDRIMTCPSCLRILYISNT
jgi:uncharacterized protein